MTATLTWGEALDVLGRGPRSGVPEGYRIEVEDISTHCKYALDKKIVEYHVIGEPEVEVRLANAVQWELP